MSHLYLIGFLESGNLTLGKRLAEHRKRPFVDTDTELAEFLGKDLVTAWQEQGVDAFYRHQHDRLRFLTTREIPHVVSVGDNAALQERDWELLKDTGTTVYIQYSAERLYWRLRHDTRRPPLLHTHNKERKALIESMLVEREPAYLQSDLVVPCKHEEVSDITTIITEWLLPQTIHTNPSPCK